MSKLILGTSGFGRLAKGYEINVNDIKTKTFTVAASETTGIEGGDCLVATANAQVYASPSTTSDTVVGICLATNVKTDTTFPQSAGEVKFMPGEHGGCVISGEVAVKLHGTAPKEGAAVYYDLTNKAFTATSASTLPCPNMRFSGITEGNLTVVRVLY